MDKKDVHAEMKHDLDYPLSLTSFERIWLEEFEHVRIPPEQRLGKCETCKLYHDSIIATKDHGARKVFKSERHKHMVFVKAERMVYHNWRQRARDEPLKYLCVIVGSSFNFCYMFLEVASQHLCVDRWHGSK
jgi:hypothetical protein